jgi:Rieske Fe-S protein
MTSPNETDRGRTCDGCAIGASRRDFIKDLVAFGALAAALGAPAEALAGGVGIARAPARAGASVRYPVPAMSGVTIDRDHQVILVRWQDTAYAFALSCPHQNTALRWIGRNARFQCPRHESKYTPDGNFISGRATRGMDRYAIRLEGGELEVDLNTLYEQDRDPGAWDAAAAALGPGTGS